MHKKLYQVAVVSRTDQTSHHTSNSRSDAKEMCHRRCINEFILLHVSTESMQASCEQRTGTFFCVMTTEVSLPLTEIAVCPEPEIALNAYSVHIQVNAEMPGRHQIHDKHTNLIQPPLWRENGEISIVGCS